MPRAIVQRRTTFALVLALLLLFGFAALALAAPYAVAIFMGATLALVCAPVQRALVARRIPNLIAAAVVTIGLAAAICVPAVVVARLAAVRTASLAKDLNPRTLLKTAPVKETLRTVGPIVGGVTPLRRRVTRHLEAAFKKSSLWVLSLLKYVPHALLQMALALLSCFIFLKDGRRLARWLLENLPMDRDLLAELISMTKDTALGTVWANLAVAAVQTSMILTSFLSLDVPQPFLAGTATFVLAWMPVFGSAPVWALGAIYLYLNGWSGRVAILLLAWAATIFLERLARPWIAHHSRQMHFLLTFISILGGIREFGILGAFIGPVIAAIAVTLIEMWPTVARRCGVPLNWRLRAGSSA